MLKNNYQAAYSRLVSSEKSLAKKNVRNEYNQVIQSYKKKRYIQLVKDEEDIKESRWFLPHFPIIKPEKATTKIRIVFDGSAKFNDICLNDVVEKGPKLQQDLFKILCQFRSAPVAVVCDVSEMYLQIKLEPDDRTYHRFLWRHQE